MRIKQIIDLDGVICDFDRAFSEVANELYGTPLVTDPNEVKHWNWSKWYPLTQDQIDKVWHLIKNDITDFWFNRIRPLQSEVVISRLNDLSRVVPTYFVTSRPQTKGVPVEVQTRLWLSFHGISAPQVIVSSRKGLVAQGFGATHFIDDKFSNCLDVLKNSRGTESFLLKRAHNEVFLDLCPDFFTDSNGIFAVELLPKYLDEVERVYGSV